ncbi:MAG: DUF4093 domain-containing protein [Oscillospiraceae bacterium]|jgi:ribonuclease M5|nr:DUF4093 domain-containing protein [Oscillospiraceae bacterium]
MRIKIEEAVVVEGKYDKIRLESLLDTIIIVTGGFSIFKDKEKMAMLRMLAEKKGLLVLTDSDSAGFVIRNYLTGSINPDRIKHAYIPDISGKERRKAAPSKEGKIGVEGMTTETLLDALKNAGVTVIGSCADSSDSDMLKAPPEKDALIAKSDFIDDGLIGRENSSLLRKALLRELRLPELMSTNALLKVINTAASKEEYIRIIEKIKNSEQE